MIEKLKKDLAEEGEIFLRVKVVPKSGEQRISEIMDDGTIKIKLKSAAEKGAANQDLEKFLKKETGGNIKIISGQSSRTKLIKIWI